MSEIFITGHRHPDLDSICSAFGYAALKNQLDKENTYVPIRCDHMSSSVKKQLEAVGIQPPVYLRDVSPKVGDVVLSSDPIDADSPIYNLVKTYNESRPSAFPVFDGGRFHALLSIDDIASWFLRDNASEAPRYQMSTDNFSSVIPGTMLKQGKKEINVSLLAGAAAYDEFCSYVDSEPEAVIVMGNRKRNLEYALRHKVPAVVITTTADASEIDVDYSSYEGTLYVTKLGTSEVLRRLRMTPAVRTIIGKQGDPLQVTDSFDDARESLMDSKLRGLPVFSGEEYVGFVTRRCFLKKPSKGVILMDHNEIGQSIRGIESARVQEIIDHHRLDALKTDLPIFIDAEPLGSTCTIVYQQYLRHNIVPDEYIAKVLLTGVISDTVILRSPTTTALDKATAGALAAISGEYDIQAFGEKLFSATETLASRDPLSAIKSDFKEYHEGGVKIGIGQVETTTLKDLDSYVEKYLETLETTRVASGLDWALLMITDVLRSRSVLLATESKMNRKLQYTKLSQNVFDMPGVMSRKKQLLPEVLHTLE